jgi:hypothetical protein
MFVMIMVPVKVVYSTTSDMEWQSTIFPLTATPPVAWERFGYSVEVGDVNGDNLDDIIVMSERYIRVYEGSQLTDPPIPPPMLEIDLSWSQYSATGGDLALADVNNDNILDIIYGMYYLDTQNGWIYVFYGRSEWTTGSTPIQLDYNDDDDWWAGSPSNAPGGGGGQYGFSVANAGDLNIDGITDVIVGAPTEEGKGKAYVYYGSSTVSPGEFRNPDATIPPTGTWGLWQNGIKYNIEGDLGTAVAKDGHYIGSTFTSDNFIIGIPRADIDLNGDDYFQTTEQNIGVALLGPRWWALSGDDAYNTNFGYSLGNAGDVNGDGNSEVLICARRWAASAAPQPKVFLYLGDEDRVDTTQYSWSVEGIPYDNSLSASAKYTIPPVGSAGDINGDDYDDIFVGDPSYNPDSIHGADGRVHIWFGGQPTTEDPTGLGQNPTPESADIILDPSDVGHVFAPNMCVSFGHSVASGDINGDSVDDIVIGDPYAYHPEGGTDPGVQSGAVHVFFSAFELTREALWNRLVEIILAWPTATPEEREELWEEIVEIILRWPTAP